jgi:DNA-binding LytR/AlgR family response regulator
MRVLIVDDEAAARRRMAIMLEELDLEVIGEAENGLRALELITERKPDVLLLDIAMPEIDGFDVVRHLPAHKPLIIFQTAYDEFALKAFEHEALDYLIKPVTLDRLQRALDRARDRLTVKDRPQITHDLVQRLQEAIQGAPTRQPRVLVRHAGAHMLLPYDEVLTFAATEGIVHARTAGTRYLTDYTLTELETKTGPAFLRPNRAELVNVNHVTSIASNGDGSATLTLSDKSSIRVTRRRAAAVRALLKG